MDGFRRVRRRVFCWIHRAWIDQSNLVGLKSRAGVFSKKTACVTFVASRTGLIYDQEDAIGVAIDSDFENMLPMPAFFAFAPKLVSGSTEVGSKSGLEGFLVGLLVHPSHHQNSPCFCILGDGR